MGSTTGSIIITVKGKEVYVGTAPPSSPVDNELWLDISENNVLKYYKASTKTWCVVNDVSEKFGDVYKYLQTNYYTKTETNSAVKEEIGKTTIIKKDGTVVNMKDAINSVIDTATEHTQKIEDINSKYNSVTGEITSVETIATQTANKFNWLVKSGTSATDFTLTDRTATLVSDYINLKGLVTFSGLNSDAQNKINTANTTANSANTKAQGIIDNIYTKNTTTIDGGKIATESIKASSIDVNNLFAQKITATGSITSPLLQSDDYIYTGATIEGEEYSDSGMIVDLRNKIIRTPKFCLRKDGTMFASEIHGGRYYGSTSSEMAFIFHGFTGGNKYEADLLKVYGNSADGTSYTTYINTDNDLFQFMKPCAFPYGVSSDGINSIGDVIAGVGTNNQVSLQGLNNTVNTFIEKAYLTKGDRVPIFFYTGGFITGGGQTVCFFLPTRLIIGASKATFSFASGEGITVRQGSKYCYGSTADVNVRPKYQSISFVEGGVNVALEMSNATNVSNNDACGVALYGTLTLS